MPETFEPRIVAFFCNWCTYLAADLAGTARLKYAPNTRVVRVMCSGRVDPQFVLKAFAEGADGVLLRFPFELAGRRRIAHFIDRDAENLAGRAERKKRARTRLGKVKHRPLIRQQSA